MQCLIMLVPQLLLLTPSVLLLATPALAQYQQSSDPDCALIIPGGSYNDVSGGTCITFADVNAAFAAAKQTVGLPPVRGKKFEVRDVGNLGTVLQETSRFLAKQFNLSPDAIASGLPLIDTTKTSIEAYCPRFLMTPTCKVERYRSTTGMCNNIEHPHWGAAMNGHHRFLAPDFADAIAAPRQAASGRPLPSARAVSTAAHKDEGYHDHAVTVMMVAWGQFVDHDITLTGETKDAITKKTPKCCDEASHPNCLPIEIPENDAFYREHNQRCMNFVRTEAGLKYNCRLGTRDSFNQISAVLDAGPLYGNTDDDFQKLRSYRGGRMKMLPVFEEFNMKELLPLKLEDPDEGCIRPSEDVYCFLAGDPRVNEQTVLAVIHTVFTREHNRICDELARINPHWNDETIFQETRHIVAAIMQHITYNEFLPMTLGKDVMHRHDLILLKDGFADTYDPYTNPSAASGFVTAAFRFGHTLLPSTVERWSKTHRYVGSQRLSEMLQQPYDLYKGGWADTYLMGLVNQVAQAHDDSVTQEVTNHLFQEPGKHFGLDLAALNIQRGREHGVPSYNRWREWCGFPAIRSWNELYSLMRNETVNGYRRVYESPEDLDLWSAAISEKSLPGALVGPTLACIIGKQFRNLRHGDRFWYENSGYPSSFTIEQLNAIRKIHLSRIICDNGDDIETIQLYGMVLPDHEINPRVPCNSQVLPKLDLSLWKDASYGQYSPF